MPQAAICGAGIAATGVATGCETLWQIVERALAGDATIAVDSILYVLCGYLLLVGYELWLLRELTGESDWP